MCGKSYYCDYCECFMKNDINVRKSHNNGMSHNVAKANYLQSYKDPQQVIAEEKKKIPCKRFLNHNPCQFGFFCRYSHYSPEELVHLESLVNKDNCFMEDRKEQSGPRLPWKYPNGRKDLPALTPSMEIMDFDKVTDSCFLNQWG